MKMTIKNLDFPERVKSKIMKIKNISKLHIEFISGNKTIALLCFISDYSIKPRYTLQLTWFFA